MGEVPDDKLGHHRLKLDRIAFYGRTLGEYLLMFGINDIASLERYNTILDCPSGASSFVAEANTEHGIQAIGCDRLFDKDVETLSKGGRTISNMSYKEFLQILTFTNGTFILQLTN
jgi:hypothetical protein